jgi:Flp pilus assembly pilin Flp
MSPHAIRRFLVFRYFLASQSGTTAIEYSVICALIFLVIVTPLQMFGPSLTGIFEKVILGFK